MRFSNVTEEVWEQMLHIPYNIRADSRFAPSQREMLLLCNDVSHWLGTSLESALQHVLKIQIQTVVYSTYKYTWKFYFRITLYKYKLQVWTWHGETRAVRDCLIRPYARTSECFVSYLCLNYECTVGHNDPIPAKCELNISIEYTYQLSSWNLKKHLDNNTKVNRIKRLTIQVCVQNVKNLS